MPPPALDSPRRPPTPFGRPGWVLLAVGLALSSGACASNDSSEGRQALLDEFTANRAALGMTQDTLMRHANVSSFILSWAEEVQPAGSANLWDGMKLLRRRPEVRLQRGAYDDLVTRGLLAEAVADAQLRRDVIDFYGSLADVSESGTAEYRRLVEHYEAVLGPGEWRNVFEVELGEGAFPVDYRKNLQALVADNHEAVLRGLIRGQADYIGDVAAAIRSADDLIGRLRSAP